ncbi:MAG: tetratricopeptide repeat protein [Treponema sp.]|jgi:tetratricopeptide (TPR) repeat protein|nr:tetratricopeptide repeat protein [Treponema sp.]
MAAQKDGGKNKEEKAEKAETPADGKLQEGIRLFNDKKWEEALKEFLSVNTAKFNNDDRTELRYYLGLCYAKLEQYEDAILYLEQVISTGGDVLRVYQCRMTMAYIYIVTNRARMAEFELKRLQDSGFESPLLYNTLAYAAWTRRRGRNAIELYEKTLEIDTNNLTAMNCMGYILADTGIDNLRGLRLCKKAVDAKPHSAAYLDSLGWAYYKNGEMVEARTWLRRALDLAPDEKEIQNHFKIVTGEEV